MLKSGQTDVDDMHRRIIALKERPVPIAKTTDLFHYDPNEPLRLVTNAVLKDTGE